MYNCQFDKAVFTPGADPEFPIGGVDPFGGRCGPPTWVLSGENVCENERIVSRRGMCAGKFKM